MRSLSRSARDLAAEAYAIEFSPAGASVSAGARAGHALRADHARPDPARRAPSPRDVRVSGRRRDPRRAGARLARHPSRRRQAILCNRRDQALPENSRLEQAQPFPLAPVRRRGVARRDRRLSPTDGRRRLARPWLEGSGAARLRAAAVGRLLQQGRDPRDRRAGRPPRHRRDAGDRRARALLRDAAGDPRIARSRRARQLFFGAGLSQQLPQPGARRDLPRAGDGLRRADRAVSVKDHPCRRRRGAARCMVGFALGPWPGCARRPARRWRPLTPNASTSSPTRTAPTRSRDRGRRCCRRSS